MQLNKPTVIALFAVTALACSKDDAPPKASEAPATAEVAAATAAAHAPTPTAAAAPAEGEATAAAHECGGAKQHEGGGCGDMMKDGAGCNQWDKAAQEVTGRDVPEGAVWASYDVDGMHCGGCERRIQAKVGELDGVVAVEASAELGKVRVAVAPEAKDGQDRAKARIAELGFKVR